MSVILKAPAEQVGTAHKSNPQVIETVAAVLDEIRANGDAAVGYSSSSRPLGSWVIPLSDDQVAKIVSVCRRPSSGASPSCRSRSWFGSGATGFDARRGDRDAARVRPGPQARSSVGLGCLRARRQIPAGNVGAHDGGDSQGGRCRARRAATPRRWAPRRRSVWRDASRSADEVYVLSGVRPSVRWP